MLRPNQFIAFLLSLTIATLAYAEDGLSSEVQALLEKAKSGDAISQFRLAAAYDYGRGAPRDATQAMKWYRSSAEQGNAEAENSVGSGLQADKRYAETISWYEKAAAQGHALATNNLAYLYDMGLGVSQDRNKAFELYSKAANLGWTEAMWNLTNMYGAGQIGKPDLVMACVWAVRAQKFAKPEERQLLAYLKRAMPQFEHMLSSEELMSCKEKGVAWSPAVPE